MNAKKFVTVALLLFVGASVVTAAIKGLRQDPAAEGAAAKAVEPTVTDGVVVYFFHVKTRCPTCNAIEAYAAQTVRSKFADQIEAGLIEWHVVNFELQQNEHLAEKYELIASSVVLVRMQDGSQAQWKNLNRVFELVGDKEEFFKYLEDAIAGYLENT